MNLRDSVIIVTGSATGLGSAIVKQVAAKGSRVVINYTKSCLLYTSPSPRDS